MPQSQRQQLRQSLRRARRALTPRQQQTAASAVREALAVEPWFVQASRVAFYRAADGELDPEPTWRLALASGKSCFLPIMGEDDSLTFAPWHADTSLHTNALGIAEPPAQKLLAPKALDLVLVPLVGFDAQGSRLGMGKGYYDRTFEFKLEDGASKPWLVGLAHACQQVQALEAASWDVRLDAVITPEKIYRPDTA